MPQGVADYVSQYQCKLCLGSAEVIRLPRYIDPDIARFGSKVDGVAHYLMQSDLLVRLMRSRDPPNEQQLVDHAGGFLGQPVEPTEFRICLCGGNARQIVAETSAQMAHVSQRRAEIVSESRDQHIAHATI